ncbi:MAG: deoxyribonuclease IV [Phycisphaerales bacterium]|nr:deoxyribonuclease IV [Phycisphaerales bacterium]
MESTPRYGSHLSIAGGMHRALEEAMRLGLGSLQVFTRNQRQWRAPPLTAEAAKAWRHAVKATGWSDPAARIVSHNSYLVNLASPDREARRRSITRQLDELERCETLGIGACVLHPGAHLGVSRTPREPNRLGAAPSKDELLGLRRIARSLDELHRSLPGYAVISCLETTTGSGTNLGYDFSHLATIRSMVAQPERVAICLDTCHIVAAGYDMSTPRLAKGVLDEFDERCGIESLRVVHVNDSVGAVASRKDIHTHIGQGICGDACFAAILSRRELCGVPMILETPKDGLCNGSPWDLANIQRLETIRRLRRTRTRARAVASVWVMVMCALGAITACSVGGCSIFQSKRAAQAPNTTPRRVVAANPTVEENAALETAGTLQLRGYHDEALALFEDLLAKNPLLPEAFVGVGDVRFAQGRYGDAEPNYRRAAKLDPAAYGAQYGHGRSLQMLGRAAESIGAYQRALAANPKSAEVNLNMATAYLSLGDARAASRYGERAVELSPKNAAAHVNLGVAYERLGRAADAIARYQTASELMTPTPQLLMNLVNAYVADRRYPEAVNTAVALTKLASGPETFERLGWAEFRAGNYELSSAAYRQAVVLDPKYWPAWNGIGVNALNRWLASDKRDGEAAAEARRAFRASMNSLPDQPKVLKLCTTYGL